MSDKNRESKSRGDKNSHWNWMVNLHIHLLHAEWFLTEAGFTPLRCTMVNDLLCKVLSQCLLDIITDLHQCLNTFFGTICQHTQSQNQQEMTSLMPA